MTGSMDAEWPSKRRREASTRTGSRGAKRHVLIIGAGLSGLAAAKVLMTDAGDRCRVTVLEGSGRVGGRAHTLEAPGFGALEMGATWLHGLEGNPIAELAKEYGLMAEAQGRRRRRQRRCISVEGERECLQGVEAAAALSASRAYADVIRSCEEGEVSCDPGTSVGDLLGERWRALQQQETSRPDCMKGRLEQIRAASWLYSEKLQLCIDGHHTSWGLSASGMSEYETLKGPNVRIAGGYQNVAKRLADGLDIKFGCIVTKVCYGPDGVTVECSDGQVYMADAAIVTVSVGVLKSNHQKMFSPALPPSKVDAIQNIGFGVVDKVFLSCSPAKNPKLGQAPSGSGRLGIIDEANNATSCMAKSALRDLIDDPDCYGRINAYFGRNPNTYMFLWGCNPGDAEMLKICPDHVGKREHAQVESGGPIGGEKEEPGWLPPWAWGIGSLHREEPKDAAKSEGYVGMVWLSGKDALDMEAASEHQVQEVWRNLYRRFPVLSRSSEVTEDASVCRTTWGTNPLFLGSWSYVATGASGEDFEVLGEPICREGRPVLLFCGEATSRHHYGTAHGAYDSGRREASRLIQSWSASSIPRRPQRSLSRRLSDLARGAIGAGEREAGRVREAWRASGKGGQQGGIGRRVRDLVARTTLAGLWSIAWG